jgi:tRNA pseudouridine38-40 synthase
LEIALPVPRYKLTVAYDGADFCGWQKQEPQDPGVAGAAETGAVARARVEGLAAGREGRIALRTVQAVLERAVREVVREPVIVTGASRTDAGVHAWGQVAAFTCSGDEAGEAEEGVGGEEAEQEGAGERRRAGGWPVSRGVDTLVRAVNARLPDDVLVRAAEVVAAPFDAIADCTSKGYSYTFHCSHDRPLWDRRFVCHTRHELDVGAMAAGAQALVGEHDFCAMAAAGHGRSSTARTVYACDVAELSPAPDVGPGDARRVRIDISGNGFLYNMVRIIAGTLHEIGRGRMAPEAVADVLASRDRRRAGPTMPPDGLRLEWVEYGVVAGKMKRTENGE